MHDYFCNLGGSDALVRVLHDLFPDAPVYTLLVYNRNRSHELVRDLDLRVSFLQRLPFAGRTHQPFLPLMPFAVEQFDMDAYSLVISSSHTVAKGVLTGPEAVHVCYCHTPMRYAWDLYGDYLRGMNALQRFLTAWVMHRIRLWDMMSSSRVDHFIANSRFVASRITKYYRRTATVIPPPVDTTFYTYDAQDDSGDYFLVVSRLTAYKRVDLVVEAFNHLNLPLHIVGDGPEFSRLKMMARSNITFLGRQPRTVLREQFAGCKALVFAGKEDFGIVPVEAMAAGRPVLAYRGGGVLDTVVEGVSGHFFDAQTVEALIGGVGEMMSMRFDRGAIREHALQFGNDKFKARITSFIEEKSTKHGNEVF